MPRYHIQNHVQNHVQTTDSTIAETQTSIFVVKPSMAQIALTCRDIGSLKTFVETGTLGGATSAWAAQHFDLVYTIEKHPGFQENNIKRLGHVPNIKFLTGDSRVLLSSVLAEVGPSLLWLDAHFTGDYEHGRRTHDECPLREELTAVVASEQPHFVFIDDAYFFTRETNLKLDISQWPSLEEIKNMLSQWNIILAREWQVILAIPRQYAQVPEIIAEIRREHAI